MPTIDAFQCLGNVIFLGDLNICGRNSFIRKEWLCHVGCFMSVSFDYLKYVFTIKKCLPEWENGSSNSVEFVYEIILQPTPAILTCRR